VRHQFLEIAVLTLVIGVATVWVGWWAVPLVGAGWGFARHEEGMPALTSAVSASLAWVLLLAYAATTGPIGEFSTAVGGTMGLPGWAVIGVTLLFPAFLAGLAAAAGDTISMMRR